MKKQIRLLIVCFAVLWLLGIGLTDASAIQLEQRPAEEYIERMDRPQRVAGLKVDEVIAKLKLKPGDVVADIGSGSGAFSIIAPSGVAKGFYRHSSY